jgi:hypothetical protein
MLENLSEKMRECYRQAEECEGHAAAERDPTLRKEFLDTARRWTLLAHSYEFAERLNRFTAQTR